MERDSGSTIDNVINGAVYGTAVQAHTVSGGIHVQQTMSPVHIVHTTGAEDGHRFGVGSVVEVGGERFLVQDHPLVAEAITSDGMTVRRRAPVALLDGAGFGWLRQVDDRYADPAAGRLLADEHELARRLGFRACSVSIAVRPPPW